MSAMLYLMRILLLLSTMRASCVVLVDLAVKHTFLSLLLIGFSLYILLFIVLDRCVLKGIN